MKTDMLKARDSLGYLSYKTSRVISNALAAKFAENGINVTVEQWRVLMPLSKVDGLPQGRIGEVLMQEKTGISRLVAGLERHGYVRRESDPQDRRLKRLFITDAGRELVERTIVLMHEVNDVVEQGIAPERLASAKEVMHKVLENLLGHPDPAVACSQEQQCDKEDD
jgi:DNA-binding MarR family transcriptional regulator